MLVITPLLQAQEWNIAEKSVTGVFNSSKSKSELFASINKWISINYNSAQNVIQMNDAESGTIIIKGINEVTYANKPGKVMAPNTKHVQDNVTAKFNHTIEINVKENKFRIIYMLTEMISPDPSATAYSNQFFAAINLNGENSAEIQSYIDTMETFLKQGMIGKDKRERWKVAMRETFKEVGENIVVSLKSKMLSIEKSTIAEDKW